LRFAPDISVRVVMETLGGRKIAFCIIPHASCTPTVRLNLDLALPH
jgi:hypothetical protein